MTKEKPELVCVLSVAEATLFCLLYTSDAADEL